MAAKLLNGDEIAERMKEETARQTEQLKARGIQPHLVAVQVGEPPASKVYTRFQAKACESVGIEYDLRILPEDITEQQLCDEVAALNAQSEVSGIILQMPLPAGIDARTVQTSISPAKDVEGMHALNYGRLFGGTGHVAPCTAVAAVELLKSTGMDLAGQEAVIVGHSEIVGKPIAMILLQSLNESPTVTVCHIATRDLAAHTRQADILFVATGVRQARWQGYKARKAKGESPDLPNLSGLITADMVKPGAVVIDVAINRIPAGFDDEGKPVLNDKGKTKIVTVGDVDFDGVKEVAGYITPVPGGVGPVTVQMLLKNTIACAQQAS